MKSYKVKPDFDRDELKRLLTEFIKTNKKAKSIARKIEMEILIRKNNQLKPDTLIQFSKWCSTNPPYTGGQKVARKISKLLFGKIIDRID